MSAPEPAASPDTGARPSLSPARRRRLRARNLMLLRLAWGAVLLLVLAWSLWQPLPWPERLALWVLLTVLADEAGHWYGFIGVLLGALPFFATAAPPAQWWAILPLVGGALLALLVVKHAGGPLVLPFAWAVFAAAILGAARLSPSIDDTLTLPMNHTFQRTSLLMAALGLGFSLLRQLTGLYLRRRAEQLRPVVAG
ncbi:hypothetical protein [Deinococcus sonorensis]|uniref:Uncharacterized protein n=2 Tax=Deinococcus sonorensis TaxID=309891 RepID=A0AAU7U8N5_9DEIO